MVKFNWPLRKGPELYPDRPPNPATTNIEIVPSVGGNDADDFAAAQTILGEHDGRINQFIQQQRRGYSLGTNQLATNKNTHPDIDMRYVNQFGHETINLRVYPFTERVLETPIIQRTDIMLDGYIGILFRSWPDKGPLIVDFSPGDFICHVAPPAYALPGFLGHPFSPLTPVYYPNGILQGYYICEGAPQGSTTVQFPVDPCIFRIMLNGTHIYEYTQPVLPYWYWGSNEKGSFHDDLVYFRCGPNALKAQSYRDKLNTIKGRLLHCVPSRSEKGARLSPQLPAYPLFETDVSKFWKGIESGLVPVNLIDGGELPLKDGALDALGPNTLDIVQVAGRKEQFLEAIPFAEFFDRDPKTYRLVSQSWQFRDPQGQQTILVNDKPKYFFPGAYISETYPTLDVLTEAVTNSHNADGGKEGFVTDLQYVDTRKYAFGVVKSGLDDPMAGPAIQGSMYFNLSVDAPKTYPVDTFLTGSGLGRWNRDTQPLSTNVYENGISDWLLFVRSLEPRIWPYYDTTITTQTELGVRTFRPIQSPATAPMAEEKFKSKNVHDIG